MDLLGVMLGAHLSWVLVKSASQHPAPAPYYVARVCMCFAVDLQHHNWGQALSSVFADHRNVTLGYNRDVAAGQPYRVAKTASLNLVSFHYPHVCTKPDWCDATVGLQLLSGCLTTGKWITGGFPRMLVDTFGRPDMFC